MSNDFGIGDRGPGLCLSSVIDFLLVLFASLYPLPVFLYHALCPKPVPYPSASCCVQPMQCEVKVFISPAPFETAAHRG